MPGGADAAATSCPCWLRDQPNAAFFDALHCNAFVKLIGGDSVDPNLVHSEAAQFPEPSMVPAGQSADKVCGEAPQLVTEKEGV